ncbi:hypothetical protein NC981_21565 [Leptolyngbya sp. DQ-M1]|uniref:hypothetical protein n=1 Tax=Leptolyngbya sp. DQ-M1 TaxID=2933920 RepID=UPI003296CC94
MTTTEINATGMDQIFSNYLAIVLGEKSVPRKRGVNRKLFQDSLNLYASASGARPNELLKAAQSGDANARRLLISAAVSGWRRQTESALFTQSEGLINV